MPPFTHAAVHTHSQTISTFIQVAKLYAAYQVERRQAGKAGVVYAPTTYRGIGGAAALASQREGDADAARGIAARMEEAPPSQRMRAPKRTLLPTRLDLAVRMQRGAALQFGASAQLPVGAATR